MKPTVSVIVPTFERIQFLPQCLDAILQQSFEDFELIVVDDGSNDTRHLEFQRFLEDPRVSVLRLPSNQGVSAARNKGIEKAKGKWLAFCDSDDLWLPKKLQQQLALYQEKPEAVVCYGNEIWIRNGKRVNPKKIHQKYSGWIFSHCLPLCIVSPSCVMMKREFFTTVGLFDETLPACEDYDLWLRASLVYPFHYLEEPLIIKHGGHEGQLSKKYWGMDRFRVQALLKCLYHPKLTDNQRQQLLETLNEKCQILANGARKRNKITEARYYEQLINR